MRIFWRTIFFSLDWFFGLSGAKRSMVGSLYWRSSLGVKSTWTSSPSSSNSSASGNSSYASGSSGHSSSGRYISGVAGATISASGKGSVNGSSANTSPVSGSTGCPSIERGVGRTALASSCSLSAAAASSAALASFSRNFCSRRSLRFSIEAWKASDPFSNKS